jgi:alpha-tubulin suppressor-like RCC1 family protein
MCTQLLARCCIVSACKTTSFACATLDLLPVPDVAAIAAGANHILALTKAGIVQGAGDDQFGQVLPWS